MEKKIGVKKGFFNFYFQIEMTVELTDRQFLSLFFRILRRMVDQNFRHTQKLWAHKNGHDDKKSTEENSEKGKYSSFTAARSLVYKIGQNELSYIKNELQ